MILELFYCSAPIKTCLYFLMIEFYYIDAACPTIYI